MPELERIYSRAPPQEGVVVYHCSPVGGLLPGCEVSGMEVIRDGVKEHDFYVRFKRGRFMGYAEWLYRGFPSLEEGINKLRVRGIVPGKG